jgi:hypothetical protein
VKTQKRPLEIVFKPGKVPVEVGDLLTRRYRLQGHSKPSLAFFEGDFCCGSAGEFSHSLGQTENKTPLRFASRGVLLSARQRKLSLKRQLGLLPTQYSSSVLISVILDTAGR